MNAGNSYSKAKAHAQDCANRDGEERYLFNYGGSWWVSRGPLRAHGGWSGITAETIKPNKKKVSNDAR